MTSKEITKSVLLARVTRGNLVEKEHSGHIVVVDKDENIISQVGNNNSPVFLRSCAKPFQALPVITSGAFKKFNFSLSELAICSASHSASQEHIALVKSILNKTGLSEKDLECGSHNPFDAEMQKYLIKNSLDFCELHNNCSGKHTGMLTVCLNNNWDIKNYLDFNHPLQQEILNIIKEYCNINENIESSLDNCSAPVYGIPLFKMGAGYLRLFSSDEAALLKKTFMENPFVIGGKGRLDSSIMNASQDRLVSKTGADGLCIVTNPKENLSLVVKTMDSDSSIRAIVTLESLKQLGWLNSKELDEENIRKLSNRDIKTLKDISVGKIETTFSL